MQTFIHCHVTLHVSGVTHPSSGVLKTVSATLRGFAITQYQILLIRRARNGARGRRDIHREFWWGNLNEGDNLSDLYMDGRITLK